MTMIGKLAPGITGLIRLDHSHVLNTFHQVRAGLPARRKQALVDSACLALEMHAQLEEEIFYPTLRELALDQQVVEKNYPEHAEMRRLVVQLRGLPATDPAYDDAVLQLMRSVMHHVADEETTLLPAAEKLMPDRLGELGAEFTRRRLQLLASHAGEMMGQAARGFPESMAVMASSAMSAPGHLFTGAAAGASRGWFR